MAFIGRKPTSAPLTASDITDGIISTAKLADTSVTNAKLNADIISAETELAVAPADTDEVLISDAGTLKRLDASLIGGAGQYELVTRTAITSNVASVAFTSLTANTYHKFVLQGIDSVDNGGEDLAYQLSSDNGSSYAGGSSYLWSYWQHYSSGSNNQTASSGDSKICFADGFHTSGSDEGCHGEVIISNVGNGQRCFCWSSTSHKADGSNKFRRTSGGGYLNSGVDVDAIQFFFTSGNITGSSYAFITHYKGIIA